MATNRQVKIFINGKEIENQIKTITAEKRRMNAELEQMTRGTEAYIKKAGELRKVNGILDEHNRALKPIGGSYNSLVSGGLTKLGGLAAAAFSAEIILSYGKHLFDLSGQMELLEQRARTVFGEVFPQVTAAAEKNAAAIGLTESQYINAATAIGDFLVPMQFTRQEAADMSTQLVNLSGALAEWEGGQRSATEVSTILSKAMLGEREELKRLGIALSEEDVQNRLREKGLKGLTGEYAKQAEAIATIEIITESSADAITAFANSSDTLARKQAALRAEITNISEKLSATLYPVFERLVGIAGDVIEGVGYLADGFSAMVNPAKAAAEAYNQQSQNLSSLQSELPPLLDRYDELSSKTNLSKAEQAELTQIIQRVADVVPTAATEFDKYGKAIGLSTDRVREFLKEEEVLLARRQKKTIGRIENEISTLETLKQTQDALLKSRGTFSSASGSGLSGSFVPFTDAELKSITKRVNDLQKKIDAAKLDLEDVSGKRATRLATDNKPANAADSANDRLKTAAGAPSDKEIKAAEKQRQKEASDIEKHEENLQKIREKYRLQNYLDSLDDEEKKLAAIRAEYDKEIKEIQDSEYAKSKASTETILELERQKETALSLQREEFRKEREEKELAAEKEQTDKEVAAVAERIQKGLEARAASQEAVYEFVTSEYDQALQELENQYLELLNSTGISEDQKLQLLRAYELKKAALRKEFADKEKAETITKRQEQLNALSQSYAAYANIIGGALTALGGILGEQTAAGKVLALAQIAFNTASAISGAVAAGAGLVFPANLGAIATGVTAVLGAIGSAYKILNGNDAKAKVPQRYTGGFFDVEGQDDGRSYNAQYLGSPGTGLLPDRPVLLASERGQEYLVSNPDLQNPRVLNYVRAIENIRTARTGAGTPQFADGGFTPGAAGEGSSALAQLAPLLMQMAAVLGSLDSTLGNGIQAKLNDETAVALVQRFRVLNKASGGVL
jgi:hypothetical protein